MEMNEKIYMLRKRHNMTLEEVGNAVGVSKSTVRKWESGEIANMRRDKIATLARALHTTPAYLMGWTDDQDQDQDQDLPSASNIIPMPTMRKIPLVGNIACGEPILAEQNIECEVDIPDNIRADFALRCKGRSMEGANIFDGDIVYIRKQDMVDNGQIAAVLIEDMEAEATLKRVYYNPEEGELRLVPENPNEWTKVFRGEELNSIRILGLAVGLTRSLEDK